jgi:hypothetical protein
MHEDESQIHKQRPVTEDPSISACENVLKINNIICCLDICTHKDINTLKGIINIRVHHAVVSPGRRE